MKFSANLSTLFKGMNLLDALDEAKKHGFQYVEIQNPYECDVMQLKDKLTETGLTVDMINCHPGYGEDLGCCSVPMRELEFSKCLSETLTYTFNLNCRKVHILAGSKVPSFTDEHHTDTYISNLKIAAETLEEHCIIGLIEPICPEVIPDYFMQSYGEAIKVLEEVNCDNIKLLLDTYHLHMISGNVMENLPSLMPYAGHIQVSQAPGRLEPFTPDGKGEIPYDKVFNFLKENYHNAIGLEYYVPESKHSFEWMKKFA